MYSYLRLGALMLVIFFGFFSFVLLVKILLEALEHLLQSYLHRIIVFFSFLIHLLHLVQKSLVFLLHLVHMSLVSQVDLLHLVQRSLVF